MESENFRTIESTGKSVDEAIFRGLQELGISIDEVTIEIVRQETKGVLGIGAKPAIVKLTQRPPEEYELPDYLRPGAKEKRSFGRNDRKREKVKEPRESRFSREKRDREVSNANIDAEIRESEVKAESEVRELTANDAVAVCETNNSREKRDTEVKVSSEKHDTKEIREPRDRKEKKPSRIERPARTSTPAVVEENPVDAFGVTSSVPVVNGNASEAPVAQASPVPAEGEVRESAPAREHKPNRSRSGKPRHNNSGDNRRSEASAQEAPAINYTEEAVEGNPAAQFVKGLLEHMHVEGKVVAASGDESLHVRVDGETVGVLIGRRGETLDAMQYLASLVVNRNRKTEGYMRVTLDTEDYREKREETLRRLAKRVAHQVRSTGRPRVLEPMNPYERRILHSALQSNPFVSTHSEGDEPNRRVVVTPKRRSKQNRAEA